MINDQDHTIGVLGFSASAFLQCFPLNRAPAMAFRWHCSIIYVEKGQSLHAFEGLHQCIGGRVGGQRCEQA